MASKITLKNLENTEFSITHNDGDSAITVSSEELSKVKTIDTIAGLRSISNPSPTAWVSGYYTKGDGAFGSNIFEWDSASTDADNGGTIIKLDSVTTGRYKLRYDGAVNVKWFGAVGDGSDSASQIDSAYLAGVIYVPEGDFRSDSTTKALGFFEGTIKKTTGEINNQFLSIANGDNDKKTVPLYGVVRQDTAGSGWYFISDSGHEPNGFDKDTVSVDVDGNLVLPHLFTAKKIGGVSVTPDERLTQQGVKTGASEAVGQTKVLMYKNASFKISNSSGSVVSHVFFDGSITASIDPSTGLVTVSHPAVASASQAPLLTTGSPSSTLTPFLVSYGADNFVYGMLAGFGGYIYYDGANWQVDTKAHNKPTMSFSAGTLTITHETLSASDVVATIRNSNYVCQMDGRNSTSFTVLFKDFTGALITTADTQMKFYYVGSDIVQQRQITGYVTGFREDIKLDANKVFESSSNSWINGTREV